jgi:methionyl-tRNA formyltransferase
VNISVLCSSREHPIFPSLERWVEDRRSAHCIDLVSSARDLRGGDFLFLISCSEIVGADVRSRYGHALVVHASDLPQGRGWSPHVWQVLEGKHLIPVTLLAAEDRVDTGAIWARRVVKLQGHELYDEINEHLFAATLELMDFTIENAVDIRPQPQQDGTATYYRKRTPEDSRLDPHKTIAEQFDLLRVADTERFPCFIDYRGKRYRMFLRKEDSA